MLFWINVTNRPALNCSMLVLKFWFKSRLVFLKCCSGTIRLGLTNGLRHRLWFNLPKVTRYQLCLTKVLFNFFASLIFTFISRSWIWSLHNSYWRHFPITVITFQNIWSIFLIKFLFSLLVFLGLVILKITQHASTYSKLTTKLYITITRSN